MEYAISHSLLPTPHSPLPSTHSRHQHFRSKPIAVSVDVDAAVRVHFITEQPRAVEAVSLHQYLSPSHVDRAFAMEGARQFLPSRNRLRFASAQVQRSMVVQEVNPVRVVLFRDRERGNDGVRARVLEQSNAGVNI